MTIALESPLVGARFRPPAKQVLQCLPAGAQLMLRHEPENPYDDDHAALMVCVALDQVPESQWETLSLLCEGCGIDWNEYRLVGDPALIALGCPVSACHVGYVAARKNKTLRPEDGEKCNVDWLAALNVEFGDEPEWRWLPIARLGFNAKGFPYVRVHNVAGLHAMWLETLRDSIVGLITRETK